MFPSLVSKSTLTTKYWVQQLPLWKTKDLFPILLNEKWGRIAVVNYTSRNGNPSWMKYLLWKLPYFNVKFNPFENVTFLVASHFWRDLFSLDRFLPFYQVSISKLSKAVSYSSVQHAIKLSFLRKILFTKILELTVQKINHFRFI